MAISFLILPIAQPSSIALTHPNTSVIQNTLGQSFVLPQLELKTKPQPTFAPLPASVEYPQQLQALITKQLEQQQSACLAQSGTWNDPGGCVLPPPPPAPVVAPPSAPVVQASVATPVPTAVTGCAAYEPLVAAYTDWNVSIMMAIMQAESSCDPDAISPPDSDGLPDYGLLQIHGEDILDPAANIAAGHQKWLDQGYTAWSTYSSGAYLRYL